MHPAEDAYRRYRYRIYRFFLVRTGSHHDAEDLTQRVFVDALTALSSADTTPDSVLHWLYAVAQRRLVDEYRRRGRSIDDAIPMSRLEPTYGDDVSSSLATALATLTAEQRTVVVLRLLRGLSFPEIADLTGVSEDACKMRFSRALIAPQTVAISTRSSIASLPAMLAATRVLGLREQVADVTLPIAVALFRATGPAMNTAVAFYVAHWLGLHPSPAQMIAATAVGALMSYGAVSLPGEVSFISSIAPIALALGVPIAPLGLLVAVEMIPDIFRTVGNVTHDVALAVIVDKRAGSAPSS